MPVVSHLEVRLPEKPLTLKNIGKVLKGPQRKICKETSFVQYEKDKNVSLLSDPIPIKSLSDGTNLLHSLIATIIREGECSNAWKFVAYYFVNGGSLIPGVDYDQSYIPVAHADSSRINITIADMHRLIASILDFSHSFQNTNVPIHERVCVGTSPYYIDWFEIYYPNVPCN